ncbi:hypothetical protein BU24DRAFT_469070 [Aaosphaeria arxii CBS 175.79]|uniref:Uncharacterized protein n=1 Tax=Aaosphaeria arxii CBS 175.79 TaxID=1450172 RepID=A0A6A5X638_9PLEO|nr:uncharacterized protein BU24DRAFT_469070 [Aaosphaeria arxii CBS 175.79]KAF2008307.1 hypothetical protein BU24DRAFT_469070 [Aaosphaeria arxii CBS 175.79]
MDNVTLRATTYAPRETKSISQRIDDFENEFWGITVCRRRISLPNNDFLFEPAYAMNEGCSQHMQAAVINELQIGSVYRVPQCALQQVMVVDLFKCTHHQGSMTVVALVFDIKTVRNAVKPGCTWPDQLKGDQMCNCLLSSIFFTVNAFLFRSRLEFVRSTVSPRYGFNAHRGDLEEFDRSFTGVNRAFSSYHGPLMEMLQYPTFEMIKRCLERYKTVRKVTINITDLGSDPVAKDELVRGMDLIQAMRKDITWDVHYSCDGEESLEYRTGT